MRQGIISDDGCKASCTKLRINTKDKNASDPIDNAFAHAYGNKFIIPLDFEMLNSAMPYYHSGLRNRLCYEITFNKYGRLFIALNQTTTLNATYEIKGITLEYEIVTQLDLVRNISEEYQSMVLLYDRVTRHNTVPVNKSDTTWNWSFNNDCKSLKVS